MSAPDELPRIGYELFRAPHFVVRTGWDGGVEVETVMGGSSMIVKLDQFQARDLLIGLAWRAGMGWDLPVGPVERG